MEKTLRNVIGKNTGKTKEDEAFEKTDTIKNTCPYGTCNGSGIIPSEIDPRDAVFCECHKDRVLIQKLKNSNINQKFFDKDFDSFDNETKLSLFKPRKEPQPFEPSARIKTVLDENPNNFTKRNYTVRKLKRDIQETLNSYCEKNFNLLEQGEDVANLLLFGEPGNGKTTFAILIGIYFLKKGKKVHFTTTQDFLDAIFSKKIDPKQVAKEVDVLILDEFFNEYHTDTEFAKKRLSETLKIRESLGLITICTSNGNPKEFSLLYGKSMMSLINGTFFLFHLDRKVDGRVENIHKKFDQFDF